MIYPPKRTLRLLLAGLFFATAWFAAAEAFIVEPYGYNLDMPIGWIPVEIGGDKATFAGPEECAYLQVKVLSGSQFSEAQEISQWAAEQLGASGDSLVYEYSGQNAVFRNISFSADNYNFKGYAVCIDGEEHDFFVSSFTTEDLYDQLNDFLISSLDSFAMDMEDRNKPGPVSQFYAGSYGMESIESSYIDFAGRIEPFYYNQYALEASRVVIEREARVLTAYAQSGGVEAWKRYYRMLYRDNYERLGPVWEAFSGILAGADTGSRQTAETLLAWVQSFDYIRPGDVADILSPLEAVAEKSGDCDSRGLLYSILLEYEGIDAVLMVSARYGHSIVGVDIEGRGARFPLNGKNYLVAETSDNVQIGLIAADMADPAGWIGIDLGSNDFLYD